MDESTPSPPPAPEGPGNFEFAEVVVGNMWHLKNGATLGLFLDRNGGLLIHGKNGEFTRDICLSALATNMLTSFLVLTNHNTPLPHVELKTFSPGELSAKMNKQPPTSS